MFATLLTLVAAVSTSAQTVRISGTVPPAIAQLRSVGRANANLLLDLELRFAPRNAAQLKELLADLQNPASPRYHKWLTPDEFQAEFGPSLNDLVAARNWLLGQGFQITDDGSTEPRIKFRGNVGAIEHAFNTQIAIFGNGSKFANVIDPQVPKVLADAGMTIVGLNNFAKLIPMVQRAPGAASISAQASGAPLSPDYLSSSLGDHFAPADFDTFYDETPLLQSGIEGDGAQNGCIAIFAASNTYASIVNSFDSQFEVPAVTLSFVYISSNPGVVSDFELELLLDIEWSHATAPGVPIVAYVGNFSSGSAGTMFADIIGRAVSDNTCSAISISFSLCGEPSTYYSQTLDALFAQAATQGQSVFVAAGDDGADICGLGRPNVSEVSADPNVTAVGGTEFSPNYNSSGNDVGSTTESTWNETQILDEVAATGGGYSAVFSRPTYQNGIVSNTFRGVPDVAMTAGVTLPGTFVMEDGNGAGSATLTYVGGTSVGTPIWAGVTQLLIQRLGERLGTLNPTLYQIGAASQSAAGFRDITTGNNSTNTVTGYTAGPGYDQTTGWGSIDVDHFVMNYPGGSPASATPTASPTATATATATMTATATPTGTPTPTDPTATATATPTASPTATPKPATLSASPSTLSFGTVQEETTKSLNLTIKNTAKAGSASATITGMSFPAGVPFAIASTTCGAQLAAASSCTVTIDFTPQKTGRIVTTLTINSNATNGTLGTTVEGTGGA